MSNERVDVVVVGSGAGGSPIALALASAGAKVVVLEKGRHYKPEEFVHDEIRMCRRDFWVPYPSEEPHTVRATPDGEATKTADGWTSCIVGGGTVHYSGFFMRMKPVDMRLASTLGPIEGASLADWPISYADLEPYYSRVDATLGVSGVWKQHPFEEPRSADFPHPPLAEHPFAARIDQVGRQLGMHPFPTPRAILSRPVGTRAACTPCGMCGMYGCPSGAKGSTDQALLPAAVATGNCEIRARSMATAVTVGADGRVTGVDYVDEAGTRRSIAARTVVLACSALETARLLLLSKSARHPRGLANGSGQVGKNVVFSSLGKGYGDFKIAGRPDRQWLAGTHSPFVNRSIQDFYFMDRAVDGVRKTGTLMFLLAHANPISSVERCTHDEARKGKKSPPIWGKALKDRVREEIRDSIRLEMETFSEFLPTPGTYVDLDPAVTDKWGLPVARTTFSRHPLDGRAVRYLMDRGMEIMRGLEPDDARLEVLDGKTMFLQGGTCRFGRDPKTTVLDPDCRAHEVPNLWVTDGSFMPTMGGVPPTLTIMANAFRVGEKMAKLFKSNEL